jgi:hypothetical protein
VILLLDTSERLGPRRLIGAVVALVLLGGAVLGQTVAVVAPSLRGAPDPISDSSPVVVLGGKSERLDLALTLPGVDEGTRLLVASAGAAHDLVASGRDCAAPLVRCVVPDPYTTRGEAALVASLATDEGWTEATVVTSWWHAHRAELHLRSCLAVPFSVIPAASQGEPPTPAELIKEVVGSLDARLRPECR